jgi:zinc resistance-associated protein
MNARKSTLHAINLCPNFNLKRQSNILLLVPSETSLEEAMWKTVLAGTTALAIAGTSLVYAQQGPGGPERGNHWRPSAEDIIAFGDARIAAVHAGLKLTSEQEKNWPAVESALRDIGKQRSERFAARASADRPKDPIERLNLRADAMTQRGAALKKLADAAAPLYKSLDEGQKHRFIMLAHLQGRHFDGERDHRGPGGDPDGMRRRGPMGPEGGPRPQ